MAEAEDEGMDFVSMFAGEFKNRDGVDARLRAEKIAGLTQKQRASRIKKTPKKQINFRASVETIALMDALAKHLEVGTTDVIVMAIEELAKAKLGAKK